MAPPPGLPPSATSAGRAATSACTPIASGRCCAWRTLPLGQLEPREKLEQLRALEHGFDIQVAEAGERPGPDVNTLADLERVAALLGQDPALSR